MEHAVYRQFYELEETHWWFVGMRAICRSALARLPGLPRDGSSRCLDLGCGTGLWTKELGALGSVFGIDIAWEALDCCRARGLPWLVNASAEQLPVAAGSFDLVTALGLIEHVDDDAGFVAELARACKPGGYVLVLTSAYRALWSRHDEVVHHKRRYTQHELKALLARQGLEIVKLSYVNALLLPAIVGFRLMRRCLQPNGSTSANGSPDLFPVPQPVNRLLSGVFVAEQRLLRYLDLPFGVGLLAIARRPLHQDEASAHPSRPLGSKGFVRQMRAIWSASRPCSVWTRLHLLIRSLLCPYPVLLEFFPQRGEILDVGCGHGLLLWWLSADGHGDQRRCVGVDPDAGKIAQARLLASDTVTFLTGEVRELASACYDCVAVVDVLYAIPLADWPEFLQHCHRVLRPGGLLILKEVVNEPRWKSWLAYLQEVLAIGVFKVTKGRAPHFESLQLYRSHVESAGFRVVHLARLDAWRPHAHCVIVARK